MYKKNTINLSTLIALHGACDDIKPINKMLNSEFPHEASELSAFTFSLNTFIISLKNGKMVKHSPLNTQAFYDWLVNNKVREIRKQEKGKELQQ